MKNISGYVGQNLVIHQPTLWKRDYELKYDEEIIGKFYFTKAFSSKLSLELYSQKLEIYQPGFWNSLIAIKETGKQLPFANYKRYGFKNYGLLELPRGKRLKFTFKLFRAGYEIQTITGQPLAIFNEMFSIKERTRIFIKNSSELLDEYPWVIILAWYVSQKRKRSAAAH